MRDRIALCAESIRQELATIGEINILRLSEHLGERSLLTYQALGWLARDGVVRYTERHAQVYVSLAGLASGGSDPMAHRTEEQR